MEIWIKTDENGTCIISDNGKSAEILTELFYTKTEGIYELLKLLYLGDIKTSHFLKTLERISIAQMIPEPFKEDFLLRKQHVRSAILSVHKRIEDWEIFKRPNQYNNGEYVVIIKPFKFIIVENLISYEYEESLPFIEKVSGYNIINDACLQNKISREKRKCLRDQVRKIF